MRRPSTDFSSAAAAAEEEEASAAPAAPPDTPEVADWLATAACPGLSMTVGCYAYLDGAHFVSIVAAQACA